MSQFTITLPADPANIPMLTDRVVDILREQGWPDNDVMAVELALQEAAANAIRHGCRGDASKDLQCSVAFDEAGGIVITVRDSGAGFDPATVGNPLDPGNMLKPSGRGIFLINGLTDHVEFADAGRQLQMRKRKAPAV
jgi:serine/threonine-protein kinase RsbW